MRKTNLIKIFTMVIIAMILISFATNVFAATDDEGFENLTNRLTNNTNSNPTNSTNTNTNTNKDNTANISNNINRTNSSVYNNTSLPKTGIEDSIPVALLVVVFGISAIYAYKKISEYKNI